MLSMAGHARVTGLRTRCLLLTIVTFAAFGLVHLNGPSEAAGRHDASLVREARRTALDLVRLLNQRRYEQTCALLAAAPKNCAIGLRTGFVWAPTIRLRITAVRLTADGAVVEALADGMPGRVELVRRSGRYRVLRLADAGPSTHARTEAANR